MKSSLNESLNAVSHTNKIIDSIDELFILVLRAESSVKSYSVFGTQVYLDFYNEAKQKYPEMIYRLQYMVEDNPKQVQSLEEFNKAVQNKRAYLDEIIEIDEKQGNKTLWGQSQGKLLMDKIRLSYNNFKSEEYRLLKTRSEALKNQSNNQAWILPGLNIINFFVLVFSYYTLRRMDEKYQRNN